MNSRKILGLSRPIAWLLAVPLSLAVGLLINIVGSDSAGPATFPFFILIPSLLIISSIRQYLGKEAYFWRMLAFVVVGFIALAVYVRILFG